WLGSLKNAELRRITAFSSSLAHALDREFQSGIQVARVVAGSQFLERGDMATMALIARDAADRMGGAFLITDAEGRYLANTRVPAGEELGISEYREAIDEALAAHKPIVSDLLESSHGGWQFKILVPVETDAGTRYVLGYSPPND